MPRFLLPSPLHLSPFPVSSPKISSIGAKLGVQSVHLTQNSKFPIPRRSEIWIRKDGDGTRPNRQIGALISKIGDLQHQDHLLSEILPFLIRNDDLPIMIRRLSQIKGPDRAKQSLTFLVHCLCKNGRLQPAFDVVSAMNKTDCRASIEAYNCLLHGLCHVGRVEEALKLVHQLKLSMKLDVVTVTTVMDGFCKVGRTDEAMELLEDAMEAGVSPNTVTFNVLINGFCREGRAMEGVSLLQKMNFPDEITLRTLLRGLLRSRHVRQALEIFSKMEESGIQAQEQEMNSLIRGVCRESGSDPTVLIEAERLLGKMMEMGAEISPFTRCLIVCAFANGGLAGKALGQLEEMERGGDVACSKAKITYDVAIRVFCERGEGDVAIRALGMMIMAGRGPSMYACEKVIVEMNGQGRFLEACSVYAAAVKWGVPLVQRPRHISLTYSPMDGQDCMLLLHSVQVGHTMLNPDLVLCHNPK
ncbi:uncharacterized protein LOC144700851 [Wolffia australiana]